MPKSELPLMEAKGTLIACTGTFGEHMTIPYDSTEDTKKHIDTVQNLLELVITEIMQREMEHDDSKLYPPEKEIFDRVTQQLKGMTYGSEEYKTSLAEMKPALDHHYATYRHHPEHFSNGIHGMNLIDLIEMLMDWWAATKRHADGDIMKSIEINKARFGYSDELANFFRNTIEYLEESVKE